jgi:two-component system invasion response regulator UvrY
MRPSLSPPGAGRPRRPISTSVSYTDGLQQFLERRRQRFVAGFGAQCDAICASIDRMAADGTSVSVGKLRQLAYRLGALARTVGFSTISARASELEGLLTNATLQGFDTMQARQIADALSDALADDLAATPRTTASDPVEDAAPTRPVLRVLIVDDHAMLRGGLKALLADAFPGAAFGEASDGREAFDQLRGHHWDVALLDISLPGRNGLDLLKDITSEWPKLHTLVLSGHKEDQLAVRALKAGAKGYLTKECAPDELVRAVRKISGGGRYVSAALAEQLASETRKDRARTPHEALSDREYEVMCLMATGKTVTAIAAELSLSVKTISTYRSRILEKLGVKNSAEVVQYALRNGLVPC